MLVQANPTHSTGLPTIQSH